MTLVDRIILLLAIAGTATLYVWLWQPKGGEAETVRIWSGDEEQGRYPLTEPRTITVEGPLGQTVIEIDQGAARVAADPGARQLCVRAGWLERPGDQAHCLPNRVTVEILGGATEYDSVHY